MKLLVTGGLGFIGSNFIRHILEKRDDTEIINFDKIGIGANINNLKEYQKNKNYKFVKGDLNDCSLVEKNIKDVDVVVNFAAETHVDRSIIDPKPFIDSNFIGTFNLLEAERNIDRNIKHIQVSTDEVYGDILKGSFSEKDTLRPSNPYSAAKASADMICHSYHRTYDMDIIITRCTNNFGPYQYPEKLIPKTIIRAILNREIPIYGSGENIRDWLFVLDHCIAINTVFEKGVSGEIYNISSGNEYSVKEIVKIILDLLGKDETLMSYVEDRPGHDLRYSLNSDKIRLSLDWTNAYTFLESIEKTVNWYVKNEKWWKPLMNGNIGSTVQTFKKR